uniref:Uncharacterized protein n=1 Tax=Fundulus heteroclitus TaxID=8078 RepID=A0A3Q2P6R8_FUNHE
MATQIDKEACREAYNQVRDDNSDTKCLKEKEEEKEERKERYKEQQNQLIKYYRNKQHLDTITEEYTGLINTTCRK